MLILAIESGAAPGGEQVRTLYRNGATIGRGEINDWVLPDPERHLSKRHCVVAFADGQYTLTDTSTNGVFINDSAEPVGRGNSVTLRDGDLIRIGGYAIRAKITPDVDPAPAQPAVPGPDDTFAAKLASDLGRPLDEPDPFGLGAPVPEPPPPSVAAVGPGPDPIPPDRTIAGLPPTAGAMDPDPGLVPPDRTVAGVPPEPAVPEITPLGDLDDDPIFGPPQRAPEIPERGAEPDHIPAPQAHFSPPRAAEPPAGGAIIPEDWDLGPEDGVPAPAAPTPAASVPPAAPAPVVPPAAPPAALRAAEPPAARVVEPPTGDPVAAFLAAAGVAPGRLSAAEAAAMMSLAGECFRAMVAGMREILMARASLKNEFRVERTMIRAADNNPLKFSPCPEEALLALLRPARGYMPGPAAVQEGFRDMQAHQLATLAGMQVALRALLEQFDPKNLKQRLEQHSLLSSILPAMRKAKYWEVYEALYEKVAQEAQDSFHGVYGRAFAAAYEEQVKKL